LREERLELTQLCDIDIREMDRRHDPEAVHGFESLRREEILQECLLDRGTGRRRKRRPRRHEGHQDVQLARDERTDRPPQIAERLRQEALTHCQDVLWAVRGEQLLHDRLLPLKKCAKNIQRVLVSLQRLRQQKGAQCPEKAEIQALRYHLVRLQLLPEVPGGRSCEAPRTLVVERDE